MQHRLFECYIYINKLDPDLYNRETGGKVNMEGVKAVKID